MPTVLFLTPDRSQDSCRFPGLENADDLVGLGPLEVTIDKLVTASSWSVQDRRLPFLRATLDPVVELRGNFPQHVAADRIQPTVGIKEPDYPFLLLERLNDSIQ
jgi:hypothetical protein